jgi:hypothetical protein
VAENEGDVNNTTNGPIDGAVVQAHTINGDIYFPANGRSKPRALPPYLDGLVECVEHTFRRRTSYRPMVITGPDAVRAVEEWAVRHRNGFYESGLRWLDMAQPSWRSYAAPMPADTMVLLKHVMDLNDVNEFWSRNTWRTDIPVVVATEHELEATEQEIARWSTPAGDERCATIALLPGEMDYRFQPFGYALGAGFGSAL